MTKPLEIDTVQKRFQSSLDRLPPRQLQILRLLASGLTNKAIANQLGISDGTVKSHMSYILPVLGVRRRQEAVAMLTKIQLPENHPFNSIRFDIQNHP